MKENLSFLLLGLSPNRDIFPHKGYLRKKILLITPIVEIRFGSDSVDGTKLFGTTDPILFSLGNIR